MKKTRTKVPHISAMLHVGTTKDDIAKARAVILEILNTKLAGDAAKVAAFDALKTLCEIKQVSVENCHFENHIS